MNRIWHGRKNHGRKFELIWNTIHVYTSGQFLCYQMTSKKLGFQKLEDLLNSGKQKKVSWIFCPKNTSFISYSKVLNTPTRDLLCNSGFTRSFLLCVCEKVFSIHKYLSLAHCVWFISWKVELQSTCFRTNLLKLYGYYNNGFTYYTSAHLRLF